ncbi:MAG: pyridoxamine 5'-phosphate oxidase family protein [Halobacteriales archaeon]|nr:pyridoxamine 5'-phosphate oxidase family protein [Halobacteriales archaeon]
MDRDGFIAETRRLGPYVYLATADAEATPHVVPIHIDWHRDHLYAAVGSEDAKVRNIGANPKVCLHYMVGPDTNWDSLIVWGQAEVLDSIDDKERLWSGVLTYDLERFSPGGPHNSPGTVFIRVRVRRAVLLKNFGFAGRDEWNPTPG